MNDEPQPTRNHVAPTVKYACRQLIRDDGTRDESPTTTHGCDLNLGENGQAQIFRENDLVIELRVLSLWIAMRGIYLKGVERRGVRLLYREVWLGYEELVIE